MIEFLVPHIEAAAALAAVWGPLLIIALMAIESSVVPLPSEIVMIPAGFLAARHELPPGEPLAAAALAVACGVLGSLLGAYANYFASLYLGRPLLYRVGRYFFLPPAALQRSEEIFREYGELATFVGRLLPGIRHLISIPAGLSRMDLRRFSLWTSLGATLWCAILTLIGYYLGVYSRELSYAELLERGVALLHRYTGWILLGCALTCATWVYAHRRIMHSKSTSTS